MIRKLTGVIDEMDDEGVIINVAGVGYAVACPTSLRERIACGEVATFWIETQMSEHAITLYGFASAEAWRWFCLLISVHGVGHRVALAILGALPIEALAQAITSADKNMLSSSPGVGSKLAERIIHELKDKAPAPLADITPIASETVAHAVSALIHLGYGEGEARRVAAKVAANRAQPVEETIRACLRELSP